METKQTLLITVLALVFSVGCASEKSGSSGASGPSPLCTTPGCVPVPTPPPSPTPTTYTGSTATLTLESTAALAKMFFNSNPNSPTDVRINIDMKRDADSIVISFVDGGRPIESAFGTVHPYSGHSNKSFNGWVTQNNKLIWKGFFQDTYGAIVLIIDDYVSQGDGQSGDVLGGSVWFQNFNRYYPNFGLQGPLKMCWEIQMGPYDCRTFLVGDSVRVTSSYNPNNRGPDANMYYEKLGTFSGLSKSAAGL